MVHVRPGTTRVKIEMTLLPDDIEEAEETFTVEVLRARRAVVGRAATVTILPAEPPADDVRERRVRSRSPAR